MNIANLEKIISAAVSSATKPRFVDAGEGVLIDVRFEDGKAYHHDTLFPAPKHHDLCFCGDCPAAHSSRTRKIAAGWMSVGRTYLVQGVPQKLKAVRHERHCVVLTFSSSQKKVNSSTKFKEVL